MYSSKVLISLHTFFFGKSKKNYKNGNFLKYAWPRLALKVQVKNFILNIHMLFVCIISTIIISTLFLI